MLSLVTTTPVAAVDAPSDTERPDRSVRIKARYQAHKAEISETERARYASDPIFREAKLVASARRYERIKDTDAERERNVLRYQRNREARLIRTRRSKLKTQYGITLDDYERMLASQNGVCAICRKREVSIDPQGGKVKSLAVDHCHATGKVRGLLCNACNGGLARFRDNAMALRVAADYLERQ